MKLRYQIKDYIRNSIHEISITKIKIMFELYNSSELHRAYKIMERIRRSKKLILKTEYPNYSKFETNYYNWSDEILINNHYFKVGQYWIRVMR